MGIDPATPSDDGRLTVVETHISTLFFVGDRVFKRKKPLRNAFVDFSTEAARDAACHREVELNRRLAPKVYLGVADLSLDGEELDHFVVMARLPVERRLSALLGEPDVHERLDDVAHLLARFHREARRGPDIDEACTRDALAELWRTGVEQLRPFVPEILDPQSVERMGQLAAEFLAGRGELVDQRLRDARACDGHGDLLAEDIFCMDDGPQILDCLEFDDRLRYGDVLADVAFLAMDLERLGRPDLGRSFLDRYRELSGDRWPESLADFHIAYRAHVRAKVTCLRHAQGDPTALEPARALHAQSLQHLLAARGHLVAVGGASGTGKSTVARALAERLGAIHLSTDDLRSEVTPRSAGEAGSLHSGRYEPEQRDRVYDELIGQAGRLLAAGERVVADASWAGTLHRTALEATARHASVPLAEVCCTCPPEVAGARIARRRAEGTDSSEVTPELATRLAAERDPWPDAIVLDTDRPLAEVHASVAELATRITS